MGKKISEELELKIIELLKQNKSLHEIERITKINRKTAKHVGIRNGLIELTPNPKFEIGYQMWKEGLTLSKIGKLINMNHRELSIYLKQHGEKIENSSIKYSYNENAFGEIDSEEKAYWLGFISADGCINEQRRNGVLKSMSLEIGLSIKDITHLEKFCDFIGIDKTNIKHKTSYLKSTNKTYEVCRVSVYNTKICNDLIKLGVTPRKSETIEFCQCVNDDLKIHYLRGYVDGDGYFRKISKNCLELNILASEPFSNEFIQKFNIDKYRVSYKTKETKVCNLTINSSDSKKLIEDMYLNSTIYLDRKYNKAIAVLGRNA